MQPAWTEQARSLFEFLQARAKPNEFGELVVEGKLTELFNLTGASNSNYTRIMALLREYGVIRIVQRGNRHQTTIIEITGELPPGDLLPAGHLTEAGSAATMVAAAEVRRQVAALVTWRESLERGGLNLAEVIKDYELRITKLEREVTRLGKKTNTAKQK